MGSRIVVVLHTDVMERWREDNELGEKIIRAAYGRGFDGYGSVLPPEHADTQTVAVIDSLEVVPLARSYWRAGETPENRNVRLLKELAEQMGYTVSKKRGT